MREIQASEAKTHLPQLLDDVERGEVIVITCHGRAIARLIPEMDGRREEIDQAIAGIKALMRARRHWLTVYDPSYLALAPRESVPLATLGGAFRGAARTARISLLEERSSA
jgi:prevent-host-death family protein